MILTGLGVNGSLRFREIVSNNETKDYVVDMFLRGAYTIQPDFGNLFFYMLPSGVLSGADDTTNSITTGFFVKFYDTNMTEIGTTATGKIDKYETETAFVYKTTGLISLTNLTADTFIAKGDLFYRGDAGTTALDVNICSSTAPAVSTFATADANGNKGIKLSAGADAELSFEFTISVAKNAY